MDNAPSYERIHDDVMEFDAEELVWNKIGSMLMKRTSHAVSVINYNSIKDYCN